MSAGVTSDGVITLEKGAPTVTLDLFNDPLCPRCGEFWQRNGVAVWKAVQAGKLSVRLHLVTFLDPASASKSYSSRAFAALLTAAAADSGAPGFVPFLEILFSGSGQPAEGGAEDHTDAQLAGLAATAGVSRSAADDIAQRAGLADAKKFAAEHLTDLQKRTSSPGVPAGFDAAGKQLDLDRKGWLTSLLGS